MTKRLGSFELQVAWSPRARRLAILGPSGSGKSSVLKLLAGLERCDDGRILLDGRDITRLDAAERGIAYVPQNYGLFPHLSVAEQLRFPLDADPGLAALWLDRLGLRGLEQRLPAGLSLGQQQRVALARAFIRPARLLLLDEPFSALDAPLRARLRRDFLTLQQEIPATTILVTHDPLEAALLADEVLVLEQGRVLQSDTTEYIFRRPANEHAARLLGADNVTAGVVLDERHIAVGDGASLTVAGPPLMPGRRVGWSFHPSRAHVTRAGAYQGKVEAVFQMGAACQLAVRFGDAEIRVFDGETASPPGAVCRFDIDPNAVQVWPLD